MKTPLNSIALYSLVSRPIKYRNTLIQHRNFLLTLGKDSATYKDELKTHFKLLIFVKAHALSLDTKIERGRLLNLIWKEMKYLEMY